jgi:hypothetical protein
MTPATAKFGTKMFSFARTFQKACTNAAIFAKFQILFVFAKMFAKISRISRLCSSVELDFFDIIFKKVLKMFYVSLNGRVDTKFCKF